MVLEDAILPFAEWFPAAVGYFFLAAGLFAVVALVVGFLAAAFQAGPLAGGEAVYRTITGAVVDLVSFSPRRTMALAWLAFKEGLRRKAVVVFAIFMVVLLFASWYFDVAEGTDPARIFIRNTMWMTTLLTLLLALFLSVFSLPTDFKTKTIHTIVTKPVRPGEIVLGRIIGFSAVGTILLVAMAIASALFVVRSLNHQHSVIVSQDPDIPAGERYRTDNVRNHVHAIYEDVDGNLSTEFSGHWHAVDKVEVAGKEDFRVGPPQGLLTARVPIYGKLRFISRSGVETDRGINTGNEWEYRSFIDGGSPATAIWTFSGITPDRFPKDLPEFAEGVPLEMTLRVFRTLKGDVVSAIPGSIVLVNPTSHVRSDVIPFVAREYYTDRRTIPYKLRSSDGGELDFFQDIVDESGAFEVHIQCLQLGQYFGMAQPDVYIKAREASWVWNFAKAYFGVWAQMVLVTTFGVMFSTILNAPVAMLATVGAVILGFFTSHVEDLATKEAVGGGPIESLIRIVTQDNMITPLDETPAVIVVQRLDDVLLFSVGAIGRLLPNLSQFYTGGFLEQGFNIPGDLILQQICRLAAFVVPALICGYFFLKTRETAQ